MSHRFSKITGLVLAAAMASVAFAPSGMAAPVTYDFLVTSSYGSSAGTFTYDDSSVTPGAYNNATGLLTGFDFTFKGIHYDASTANTGSLQLDAAGNLIAFFFGTSCAVGSCANYTSDDWYLSMGSGTRWDTGEATHWQDFWYDGSQRGSFTLALANAVPEPGTLGMISLGILGLIGLAMGRRKLGVSG